ncbi:hypothetical protein M0R45_023622 [Rubus argutus]|uniref:Uncharacterized protein n=1 Tax=Rubus argutus TaxID=59490 RepID=A0AAW1WQS8_RUBAR
MAKPPPNRIGPLNLFARTNQSSAPEFLTGGLDISPPLPQLPRVTVIPIGAHMSGPQPVVGDHSAVSFTTPCFICGFHAHGPEMTVSMAIMVVVVFVGMKQGVVKLTAEGSPTTGWGPDICAPIGITGTRGNWGSGGEISRPPVRNSGAELTRR